ncbi:hypothetical protein EJB05_54054, partial [Eragrostis curvula]
MAAAKAYVLMFTAFFFSGLMQLSMAQDKPAVAAARVIDAQTIDQAIAYMLIHFKKWDLWDSDACNRYPNL